MCRLTTHARVIWREHHGKFKFPSAYTILFILIALVAVMTWIVPAGKYQMAMNPTLGKEVPVAGTYAPAESHPQGITAVLLAPLTASTTTKPIPQAQSMWRCLY